MVFWSVKGSRIVRSEELRRDCLGNIVIFVFPFITFDFKTDAFLALTVLHACLSKKKSKFRIAFLLNPFLFLIFHTHLYKEFNFFYLRSFRKTNWKNCPSVCANYWNELMSSPRTGFPERMEVGKRELWDKLTSQLRWLQTLNKKSQESDTYEFSSFNFSSL